MCCIICHFLPSQCHIALPSALPLVFPWAEGGRLTAVLEACGAALARYAPFFTTMADLDEHCRILEPDPVTPTDVYRRVSLGRSGTPYDRDRGRVSI